MNGHLCKGRLCIVMQVYLQHNILDVGFLGKRAHAFLILTFIVKFPSKNLHQFPRPLMIYKCLFNQHEP